jgi:glycosyltransferase involved in cell wall biosynthesis
MSFPLVTIICISYNHEKFIKEAVDSILNQSYPQVEVIMVDDASQDGSVEVISQIVSANPDICFIRNTENKGNCRSFNIALSQAKGKYIIDFAADDVLHPDRIKKQIEVFESLSEDYGVIFTDVTYIDVHSKALHNHYKRNEKGILKEYIPSGNIYKDILSRHFVLSPTLMIKKSVFEALGGYDESLAYEDFDFIVRSSREFLYVFLDEALTYKRIVPGSLSSRFDAKGNRNMLDSTFRICEKVLWMNNNEKEDKALAVRLRYEMKQAFVLEAFDLVQQYYFFLKRMKKITFKTSFIKLMADCKIRTFSLYIIWKKLQITK